MTAFFFSSFQHQVHFDVRDGRGAIAIAKEKVTFSSCYLNRVLLGAKIAYLGLPSTCQDG
ncbi:hypothetical protein NEUTE2DRAFT_72436 [Neurospora tetrasperma FGSC 2509]|nr:hypothetical protein NEUTE2DRAFT_72436 [Neurospora tetrasperma FGSC 2509]